MDAVFEQTVVLAVLGARVLQTASEWRRLRALGFDGASVRRGFRVVLDERAARRAALRAVPAAVARRRRVFWGAVAGFALSFVVQRVARDTRTQTGPTSWHVPPHGVALFLLGNAMLGASLVLLARSPLRMPLGERLFRALWLGPLGGWLLRDGAAPNVGAAGALGTPPPRVAPLPAATPPTGAARPAATPRTAAAAPGTLAPSAVDLEARVGALERWRREVEAGAVGRGA